MIKFFTKKFNNKKGFTLIELIVVIAILGILAAIAVPQIGKFRTRAANTAHNANVRILEGAAIMYLADEGTPSVEVTWTGGTGEGGTGENEADKWKDYIAEWPEVPAGAEIEEDAPKYTVKIGIDGKVTVTPKRIADNATGGATGGE